MFLGPGQKTPNAFGDGVKKHQQGFRFFINRIKKYLMEIKKQGVMKYKEFNKK